MISCLKQKSLKSLRLQAFLFSSGDKTRTCDLWVMSPTSYQLLHPAMLVFDLIFVAFPQIVCKSRPLTFKKQVTFAKSFMVSSSFKAGFVSIVGKPNVGKSSLMNKLMGESLSIISAK